MNALYETDTCPSCGRWVSIVGGTHVECPRPETERTRKCIDCGEPVTKEADRCIPCGRIEGARKRRKIKDDTPDRLIRAAARANGVTLHDFFHITQGIGKEAVMRARIQTVVAMREMKYSYPKIGKAIGFRHHTAALHNYRRATEEDRVCASRFLKEAKVTA